MMKKYFLPLLLAVAAISFTGCIDIIEEITLKKDGSGQFKYTVDMSSIMQGGMLDLLMSMDTTKTADAGKDLEMDEKTNLADKYDELKDKIDNPEFLKRTTHHLLMSKEQQKAYAMFTLDFKNLGEVNNMLNNMDQIQKVVDDKEGGKDPLGGMLGGVGEMSGGGSSENKPAEYKGKKGKIERIEHLVPTPELSGEGEEAAMAQMMMADAKYRVIYNFPGKVKKSSNDLSELSNGGKTLTMEAGLMEYLQGKVKLDNKIKYKKR